MTPEEMLTAIELKIQELDIQKKKIDMQLTQLKAQQAKIKQLVDSQKQASQRFNLFR